VNTDVQLVRYATLTDFNANGTLQSTFDINLPQYRTQELATRVTVKIGRNGSNGWSARTATLDLVESVPFWATCQLLALCFGDAQRWIRALSADLVTATIVKDTGEFPCL